ncbi:MAG: MFS transporter [Bacteroidia bacterium]|nr:MFS transporter [Bacteroidia bacterium]
MRQTLIQSFSGISVRVWLLSLINFINRVGAMVICFLTLYLTEHLHFGLKEAGYALSFYGAGAIAGSYLGGYLTDKWGYQRVQVSSLIISGILLIVLMYVRNYYMMCGTLFIYNIIAETFRPANAIAVKMNSNDENRTRSFSLMRTSFNLAITFALTLGGLLIMQGWHFIFIADALTCFAAAAILFFFIPEVAKPVKETVNLQTLEGHHRFSPYKDKVFLLFFAFTFINALVFMQIIWTIPPFFKTVYHWDEDKIGLVSALNGFVVMLVEIPLIFRIERLKPALQWVRWGIFLYGLSYLCLLIPMTWIPAVLYMVFISFGEILVMPFSTSWVTKRSMEHTQGKYMGMYSIAYSIANTIAPILGTQIIAHFGFNSLWVFLWVLCIIVWIGFYYLEQNERQQHMHFQTQKNG